MAKLNRFKDRMAGWFVDREFFMRSNGHVRFLKFSAKLQRRLAFGTVSVFGVLLISTLGMTVHSIWTAQERSRVESAQERISKYRDSIKDVSKDLEARQDMLEKLHKQHFGTAPAAVESNSEAEKTAQKIGAIIPEAASLARLEARQISYAESLTRIALKRSALAEREIRKFGLDPKALAKNASEGMGGPFIPFLSGKNQVRDPRFTKLAVALEKMEMMERALASVPTSMPASVAMMSSSFGYRSDPFTGGGAMHSGLDFKGPHGTAILAAADGVVSFVGGQGGYGNTVEITHANGLMTRYAHLSRFTVTQGQRVVRGTQIAHMGSTGRSTGTHLHFEVRLNGQAINPLKFLEANNNVLEVKANTGTIPASSAQSTTPTSTTRAE